MCSLINTIHTFRKSALQNFTLLRNYISTRKHLRYYHLRYEKGNFKSGFCVLEHKKIVVVNKYFPLAGKVNCLVDILKELDFDLTHMCEKNKILYLELNDQQLKM